MQDTALREARLHKLPAKRKESWLQQFETLIKYPYRRSCTFTLRGINTAQNKKGRPESGRRSKQKMCPAGVRVRFECQEHHCCTHSRLPHFRLAIRFINSTDRLQDSGHSGGVLRGFTQNPPLIHASGMAVRPLCLVTSHLRAYRIGTHAMLLHLVLEGEQCTISSRHSQKHDDFY